MGLKAAIGDLFVFAGEISVYIGNSLWILMGYEWIVTIIIAHHHYYKYQCEMSSTVIAVIILYLL
jgi:hypothetical protein